MAAACVTVRLVDEHQQKAASAASLVDGYYKPLFAEQPPLALSGMPSSSPDIQRLKTKAPPAQSRLSKDQQQQRGLHVGAAAPVRRLQPEQRRALPADLRRPQTSRPPSCTFGGAKGHVGNVRFDPSWCMREAQGSPMVTSPVARIGHGHKTSPIVPLHMERSPYTAGAQVPAVPAEIQQRIKTAAATQPPPRLRDSYSRQRASSLPVRPSLLAATPGTPQSSYNLYRRERNIGKGAFGMVSLATSLLTSEPVAIKTIDRTKLFTNNLKKTVEHEIRILKRLRHPGVVRLFEVIETPRCIHLVLEFSAGGNLQQLVKAQKRIGERQAKDFLWQLLDAVDYCHSQRVCHRDLKLENFVLDAAHRRVKLIDFGLSVVWREDSQLFKSYGTPCYSAPEIMAGKSYSGPQVDVWSLGVCLCTMLTGVLPFQGATANELKRKVLNGRYSLPDFVPHGAAEMIAAMLTLPAHERAMIPSLRRMRWLTGCSSELPPKAKPTGTVGVLPCVSSLTLSEHTCSDASSTEANSSRAPSETAVSDSDETPSPLDPLVLKRLQQAGLNLNDVERSVRSGAFNHEAACYEMLLAAGSRAARRGVCSAAGRGPAVVET